MGYSDDNQGKKSHVVMNCVIVEDDPTAQATLRNYVHRCNELKLVGACDDAFEAEELLRKEQVDILFLDMELPNDYNGLELYKNLPNKPYTIVTSSYAQFALDSFNENLSDFLYKPFTFARFRQSVNKVMKIAQDAKIIDNIYKSEIEMGYYITIKDDEKGSKKIPFSEIAYFEQQDKNLIVCTVNLVKYELKRLYLTDIEAQLPPNIFQRVMKGIVVNKANAKKICNGTIEVGEKAIKLSPKFQFLGFKFWDN